MVKDLISALYIPTVPPFLAKTLVYAMGYTNPVSEVQQPAGVRMDYTHTLETRDFRLDTRDYRVETSD